MKNITTHREKGRGAGGSKGKYHHITKCHMGGGRDLKSSK